MRSLSYETLRQIGYAGYLLESAPEKVMQFGEGNFLRAFVDYFFDLSNERAGFNGKVVMVQPISMGLSEVINSQQGLYTLYLRGSEDGRRVDQKRVISSVSRCLNAYTEWDGVLDVARSDTLEIVASNTTEAGIVYDPESKFDQTPPNSFPAKLTRVLYERFKAGKKGLVILSCELIDNNGRELKKCVLRHIADWGLEEAFARWVEEDNIFCSTLVDRIVPGRVKNPDEAAAMCRENGYDDKLMDVGEVFGFWAIEGPEELNDRLPFRRADLPVTVVPDVTPYKKRKVRILNGAHTGFTLGAYLAGFDIVRDCMHDDAIRSFMNRMLNEEVMPTLPLDKKDIMQFAAAVQDRFNNPFVDHELMSISLNSTAKWKARNLPSLLDYMDIYGRLPRCLSMSLAAYIAFYSSDIQRLDEKGLVCRRPKGNEYTVSDDRWVLEFYYARRQDSAADLARAVLANRDMWGMDLTAVPHLLDSVISDLVIIRRDGAMAAFRSCLDYPQK